MSKSNNNRKNNYEKVDNEVKRGKKGHSGGRKTNYDPKIEARDSHKYPRANNDISWYVASPELLQSVATIPFSDRAAAKINTDTLLSDLKWQNQNVFDNYGVCRIGLTPTIGCIGSTDNWSGLEAPINTAMRSIYSFVRHANSGSKNYDAPDLMLYLIAMDNIYMYWNWCVRVYGYVNNYNYSNGFMPWTVLHAMGIEDPQTISTELATLRSFINTYAIMANSFAVPAVMPYFQRHMWLYRNVFCDRPDPKAQFYVYDPDVFFMYDETSGAGKLVGVDFKGHTFPDVGSIIDYGYSLINVLRESEDIGIMSGDILKAYGAENLIALAQLPENYFLSPVYDEEVLVQIHNSSIMPTSIDGAATNFTISQDVGSGQLVQSMGSLQYNTTTSMLLNLPFANPRPEDVVNATRLSALSDGKSNIACGSELVTSMILMNNTVPASLTPRSGLSLTQNNQKLTLVSNTSSDTVLAMMKNAIFSLNGTAFRYFPLTYHTWFTNPDASGTKPGSTSSLIGSAIVGDICNYTNINFSMLYNLQNACFAGLFGIPYTLTKG